MMIRRPHKHERPQSVQQGGFTLIELLVASTLTLILMLVIGGTVMDSFRFADTLTSRVALNREARLIHDALALGGDGGMGAGLRGGRAVSDVTLSDGYRLQVDDGTGTGTGRPVSSQVQARTIDCTLLRGDHPHCDGGVTEQTLTGMMEGVTLTENGAYRSVLLRLVDPSRIGRGGLVEDDYRDVFWMGFWDVTQ